MTQISFPHQAAAAAKAIKPGFIPHVGLVLGSGLGGLADLLTDATIIPYDELPGFPISTIQGHAGRLLLGYLEGVPIACLQGRVHYYEGAQNDKVKNIVRTLRVLGCEIFFATNASGSLRTDVEPGNLMLIHDHINMQGTNPLLGPNDDEFGERFVGMENAYDPALRKILHEAAKEIGFSLPEGVYLSVLGPMFETPAEIRAFRTLGADAVGMSTVSEVIVARHCGLRVAVVSAITNLASGMSDEQITHDGTLHFAGQATERMTLLINGFLRKLNV
ncbi:MAG: purine-nucleoside phosphorylase [Legionellales bacterium]|nr:purine-nucleoside phosphorylase [Legionellales bacterium]